VVASALARSTEAGGHQAHLRLGFSIEYSEVPLLGCKGPAPGKQHLPQFRSENLSGLGTGKLPQDRKANFVKIGKLAADEIELVLRRRMVGLNGNDELNLACGVQPGEYAHLIGLQVFLDTLLDRTNRELLAADIENISHTTQYADPAVCTPHGSIAGIEKSVAESLRRCLLVIKITLPIKLREADAHIAFLARRTFNTIVINDLDHSLSSGFKPQGLLFMSNSGDESRCVQFGRAIGIRETFAEYRHRFGNALGR
jgi:hypothetical protein